LFVSFDTPDTIDWGPLRLKRSKREDILKGYAVWDTLCDPTQPEYFAPLYIEIWCELTPWAQAIDLALCSRLDLWRPIRFDGTRNNAYVAENQRRLGFAIEKLAAGIGGFLAP
jgi:hypothetical protein